MVIQAPHHLTRVFFSTACRRVNMCIVQQYSRPYDLPICLRRCSQLLGNPIDTLHVVPPMHRVLP
jgi:hypothetical protein